tara:strand:+ start:1217 stop:1378 length:162 start_codon:yes stop_codon:yes gene_type:complete
MLVDLIKPEIDVALKALKDYPSLHPSDEKVYLRLIERLEQFQQICTCKEDSNV